MSGNFIYRHHVEPRVKLYSPREKSFTIPLKYIDVIRSTHTDLDGAQEKGIDDYWNVDGHKTQVLERPKGKLEDARNLRGIYSVDPSDEEYKDI